MLSFHATKVFNTFEGGAIICPDAKTKPRIDRLKNFGFADEVTVVAPGINGKMSEFNAAFGLLQLKYVDMALSRRAEIDRNYREQLGEVPGLRCLALASTKAEGYRDNYSYFPVLVDDEYGITRDELYLKLKARSIFSRRYFYPLISDFPMYRALPSSQRPNPPVAAIASERVLCLPIYPGLEADYQQRVIDLIRGA